MFAKFEPQMKETHTILIPSMIEPHFELMAEILRGEGYKAEVLGGKKEDISKHGQLAVHNDMCYPAILVIGQFLNALKSGEYDSKKVVLIMTQTGGGCRASNYIFLLRKALNDSGFGYVPVISLNFNKLDENAFYLSKKVLIKLILAVFYADLFMTLFNQCISYEVKKGETKRVSFECLNVLLPKLNSKEIYKFRKNIKFILSSFQKIELNRSQKKVRVGIVGEIYMKYSSLGNNNLNEYLISEGAEVLNTGLMDFFLTSIYHNIYDKEIYGFLSAKYYKSRVFAFVLESMQKVLIRLTKKAGFEPATPYSKVRKAAKGYISHGVKMGEGWLLTAEMVEFIQKGVDNIICAQPFGCLPNHVIARGMIRKIKEKHESANICCVDYDFSESSVNQENRIKLMLSNAKRQMSL